jgi:hypothetical protein
LVDVATDLRRPYWRRRNSSDCGASHITGKRFVIGRHRIFGSRHSQDHQSIH